MKLEDASPALAYFAANAPAGCYASITIYDATGKVIGTEMMTPTAGHNLGMVVKHSNDYENYLEASRRRTEKYRKNIAEMNGNSAVLYNRTLTIPPTSAQ